jgi:hypothetical protein
VSRILSPKRSCSARLYSLVCLQLRLTDGWLLWSVTLSLVIWEARQSFLHSSQVEDSIPPSQQTKTNVVQTTIGLDEHGGPQEDRASSRLKYPLEQLGLSGEVLEERSSGRLRYQGCDEQHDSGRLQATEMSSPRSTGQQSDIEKHGGRTRSLKGRPKTGAPFGIRRVPVPRRQPSNSESGT